MAVRVLRRYCCALQRFSSFVKQSKHASRERLICQHPTSHGRPRRSCQSNAAVQPTPAWPTCTPLAHLHRLHARTLLQVRKEFGKTKIFWLSQEGLAALTPEEAAAKQERLKGVQAEAKVAGEAVAALRRGARRSERPGRDKAQSPVRLSVAGLYGRPGVVLCHRAMPAAACAYQCAAPDGARYPAGGRNVCILRPH